MQFDERLCFLKGEAEAGSREALLRQMAGRLAQYGYVKDGFLESILRREEEYPTGLCLHQASYHIAIPHSDPEFVNTDAVAAAILEEPVAFRRMDDCEQEVAVSLVIMLAIRDAGDHMQMLAGAVRALQDADQAAGLMNVRSGKELMQYLKTMREET